MFFKLVNKWSGATKLLHITETNWSNIIYTNNYFQNKKNIGKTIIVLVFNNDFNNNKNIFF